MRKLSVNIILLLPLLVLLLSALLFQISGGLFFALCLVSPLLFMYYNWNPKVIITEAPLKITFLLFIFLFIHICFDRKIPGIYEPKASYFYLSFFVLSILYYYIGKFEKIKLDKPVMYAIVLLPFIFFVFYRLMVSTGMTDADSIGNTYENYELSMAYQVLPIEILWCLIFLLCAKGKNKKIAYGVFIIGICLLFLTGKRTPPIALMLSLLATLFFLKKISIKVLLPFVVIPVIAYLIFPDMFNLFFQRWENDMEGDNVGSSRLLIYGSILNEWINGGTIQKIFGFGHEQTHMVTGQFMYKPIGAHNDWIEFLYCYGVIGFILLLAYFIILANRVIKAIKRNELYSDVLLISLFTLFIYSFVSTSFFTIQSYYGAYVFFLLLGYSERKEDVIKNITND